MEQKRATQPTRREVLRAFLAMPATLLLAACATETAAPEPIAQAQPTTAPPTPAPASPTPVAAAPTNTPVPAPADTAAPAPAATDTPVSPALSPTPACVDDDDDPTPPQTEGPFYSPSTPERNSLLEPDMPGTKIILTGYVLATNCQPVAQALLDFWHADDSGEYDNVGFRLRGHQFADDQGRYYLETIVPGLYPGRTRHFHVKVQAPNQSVLTTQLYFPGEPGNDSDGIFNSELLMEVQDAADGKTANFNFVLEMV